MDRLRKLTGKVLPMSFRLDAIYHDVIKSEAVFYIYCFIVLSVILFVGRIFTSAKEVMFSSFVCLCLSVNHFAQKLPNGFA